MRANQTELPGVLIIEPKVYSDERGFFLETFNSRVMLSLGIDAVFVQDNHSKSLNNVLRGLHYQIKQTQGKLVRVVSGEAFDVAVDMRRSSPTFGKWVGATLSSENRLMMWIPAGFAHGFLALSDGAEVLYKATDYYAPQFERTIAWNDEDLKIRWPLQSEPVMSAKDKMGSRFRDAEAFA